MSELKVSVVICGYTMERLDDIHEAVESVLNQTLDPHEVIVAVDHNEELFNRLKSEITSEVKIVFNDGPHRGSSATDNVGISIASGDIVAFIDDDAVADKNWLEHLLKPYQDPSIVAVGGKLVPVWQTSRPKWFCEELDWTVGCTYKGHPDYRTEVRALIFCNASIRRQVFDSVGLLPADTGRLANWGTGFEAQFFMGMKSCMPDDVVLYEPAAVVYHKVTSQRAKMKYLIRRCYNEGFHKATIEKANTDLSNEPLSTESSYLRYLVLNSIPRKMMRIYQPWLLAQAGVTIICIAATGMGYLKKRVSGWRG